MESLAKGDVMPAPFLRADNRSLDHLRSINMELGYTTYPEGSVLIRQGNTHVLCNVTIEDGVPRWMQAQNIEGGWITAEYAMLPRATHTRSPREAGSNSSRTQEIRRLIGRSLRAAIDMTKIGTRTCIVDCDVLQADGGTRTAAITGGYVALALALNKLVQIGQITTDVFKSPVAAISAGIVSGSPMLDLCYAEDSQAEVDCNIVMNEKNEFIEIQATVESKPFDRTGLDELLSLATQGINELLAIQQEVLRRHREEL
jgi:ribonuclease PH